MTDKADKWASMHADKSFILSACLPVSLSEDVA